MILMIDEEDDECLKKLKEQIDAHSLEILTSFTSALSMLQNVAFVDKQNLQRPQPTPSPGHLFKSEVLEDWYAPTSPKDGRGCNMKRYLSNYFLHFKPLSSMQVLSLYL